MKKSNLITFLSLCFLIVAVILFILFWSAPTADSSANASGNSEQSNIISMPLVPTDESSPESENHETETADTEGELTGKETDEPKTPTASVDDALFIGDSRTVGLSEYALLDDADFFANVGMTVYNIHEKAVSVSNVGKVALTELLDYKKYAKIYIMLGINELGYDIDNTVVKYADLIEFIREKQPDAVIIMKANLHVTKNRSDNDKVINNNAVNEFNTAISKLADGKKIFYLDANVIFDDENGNLSSEKSEDGVHLYAKYYVEWGKWIIKQTAELIGEG